MDYKKSGAAKPAKGTPKFDPHAKTVRGKGAADGETGKAALLARMKAAAEQRKAD